MLHDEANSDVYSSEELLDRMSAKSRVANRPFFLPKICYLSIILDTTNIKKATQGRFFYILVFQMLV